MATDGFTTRPVYMGTHGVLAAGHYLAAHAGQRMFDRGGNAIDAVVASGFALNLLKPHLNGPGGEVPLLVYSAKEEKVFSISGQGFIGKAATVEWFNKEGIDLIPGDGFLPATVPAMFGSWAFALMRFGTLTLKDVLGPAIDLAESGFPVYPGLRHALAGLARAIPHGMAVVGRRLPAQRPRPGRRRRVQEPRLRRDLQEGGRGGGTRGEARPGGRHPGRHRLVVQGRCRLHDRGVHEDADPRRQPQEARRPADDGRFRRVATETGGAGHGRLSWPVGLQVRPVDARPRLPATAAAAGRLRPAEDGP